MKLTIYVPNDCKNKWGSYVWPTTWFKERGFSLGGFTVATRRVPGRRPRCLSQWVGTISL